MFYNTTGTLRPRVTHKEQDEYISKGFVKVEESAICVVSLGAMTFAFAGKKAYLICCL